MATTNSSSTQPRSLSRVNGSAVGPRAGANSAANSGKPSAWAQPNTVNRLFRPQTTASTSSQPVPDDDARQGARYPTDSPRRGASGQHNPTPPGLSSSTSSALFAPRITESPGTTTSPRSDDRGTDRETHRVAKRTVQESQLPYSNSSKSRNGSTAELHELRAGANSASNLSQPPTAWVRPDPTSRPSAPQTTTSKSARPTADDDERVAQYTTDSPRRGASGLHNATAPALSSSKSSALFAPRITESPSTTTIPQSDDRGTDWVSHRVAKRAVLEGESPYSNSSKSRNGSVAELHEDVSGANSAANTGQSRPNPTSRTFAPQTTASESSRSTAGDDAGQVGWNQMDLPRRGASMQHNPTAPVLFSSNSSALFAPRITESASTTSISQSDDRTTDRESHRVAKRTVLEGQSPYSNSSKSRDGSVAELHELRAGANSVANSSQPPTAWGRSDPTSRTFVPQTKASESSRPTAGDDTGQVARYPINVPYSFVAASSSNTSLSRAPQLGDATMPLAPVSGEPRAETNSHASKKPPKSSKQRVANVGSPAEPSLGERATQDRVGQLRRSESSQSDLLGPAQTPAGQQDNLSLPLRDPPGAKITYQVKVDPPRRANSNISESQSVDPPTRVQRPAVQPVNPSPPLDAQGEKARYQTKVDLPLGGNSNGSESKDVDLPNVARPSSRQQPHLSPQLKDPPASEGPLSFSAPAVTTTQSSRQAQNDTTLGETQASRVRTPPVYPNESRESAPLDRKGGHDPLNRQAAPKDSPGVSKTRSFRRPQDSLELPVYPSESRVSAPTDDKKGDHGDPLNRREVPNNVSSTPAAEHPLPTPPMAVYMSNQGRDPQNALRNPSTQILHRSTSNVPMLPTPPMVISPTPRNQQQRQPSASAKKKKLFCCG